MKKSPALLASIVSGIAIFLATDPGRSAFTYVDAGGHELRMLISGSGHPAVVFETGGTPADGGALEGWDRVQPRVSKFATTVSYDRAGIVWSEPGPKPRDARQVARELHTALGNAHVAPPYILVGHSFGGPLNRVFAGMYPGEVVGMVLLDPTQEEFMDWYHDWSQTHDREHDPHVNPEWKDYQPSLVEAHESRVPEGIPVVLVTAMGPRVLPAFMPEKEREEMKLVRPAWLKFHQEWVEKLPKGRHIITEKSGHGIPFEEPDLVIKTIREVFDAAQTGDGRR
ncbi:MAG TPA: alpha/beta hydrolase [Verrucomicrobiae bacterium]|jgi:pimeloyl-ACP methyl ester carboxylesterase|nr:alpha/beta hydrolase [Verrucomicrobiae bacterium]